MNSARQNDRVTLGTLLLRRAFKILRLNGMKGIKKPIEEGGKDFCSFNYIFFDREENAVGFDVSAFLEAAFHIGNFQNMQLYKHLLKTYQQTKEIRVGINKIPSVVGSEEVFFTSFVREKIKLRLSIANPS